MYIITRPNQFNMVEHIRSGNVLMSFQSKMQKLCEEQQLLNAEVAKNAEPPWDALNKTMAVYQARLQVAYNAVILGACSDPTVVHIATAVQFAAGSIMPYKALQHKKRFMCRKMRKPADMKVWQYVSHLVWINVEELPSMPPFTASQKLSKDKIMDIIMFSILWSWECEMHCQDFDPLWGGVVLHQLVEFCKRIEVMEDNAAMKNSSRHIKKQKTSTWKPVKSKGMYCMILANEPFSRSWRTARKKVERRSPRLGQKSSDTKMFIKKDLNAIVKKASDKVYK